MSKIIDDLINALGPDSVLLAPEDKETYEQDWRGRYRGTALCVALPRNTEEVSRIVSLCAQHGHPIVPQGGNTGLSGGSVPNGPGAVVLSLKRMSRVISIDEVEGSMVVEAGCILANIHAAADEAGWNYPLHLGAEGSCQIGGNISTNAGGTSVIRYGNCRDSVLGLEVVLPNGSIWNGLNALRKNNTGYDLKHLFIGAEGTLGIVTRAVLKLSPKPADVATAWVAVTSAEQAVALASKARTALDTAITAVELMNAEQVRLVLKHVPNTRQVMSHNYPYFVLLEVSSMRADGSAAAMLEQLLADAMESGIAADAIQAASSAHAANFWQIRHGVAQANRAEGMGITMDVAVPVSRVSAFMAEADAEVGRKFPQAVPVVVSHLGDGNVHYIAMVPAEAWAKMEDKPAYIHAVRESINDIAVRHHQGTFSAEHGVGQTYVAEIGRYKSEVELGLLRGLKSLLDPQGLFNPNKLMPPAIG